MSVGVSVSHGWPYYFWMRFISSFSSLVLYSFIPSLIFQLVLFLWNYSVSWNMSHAHRSVMETLINFPIAYFPIVHLYIIFHTCVYMDQTRSAFPLSAGWDFTLRESLMRLHWADFAVDSLVKKEIKHYCRPLCAELLLPHRQVQAGWHCRVSIQISLTDWPLDSEDTLLTNHCTARNQVDHLHIAQLALEIDIKQLRILLASTAQLRNLLEDQYHEFHLKFHWLWGAHKLVVYEWDQELILLEAYS